MKNELIQNQLVVKRSPIHGYGVFAGKNINNEEIVEECYALLNDECYAGFMDYYFCFGEQCALLTGFGSIYNHSDQPNAYTVFDEDSGVFTFYACQPIVAGEEIFINYGPDWFTGRGNRGVKKKPRSWYYQIRRVMHFIHWRAVIGLVGTLGTIALLKQIAS